RFRPRGWRAGRHWRAVATHARRQGRCQGAIENQGSECPRRYHRRRPRAGEDQMSISELFIKRPVMTVLVMLGIVVFGIVSYERLPVSDLPTIDFPTISVQASLPGASPETMASAVATPLEKQFSTIAGID